MDPSVQASSSRAKLAKGKKCNSERSSHSRNIFSSLIHRSSRTQPSKLDEQRHRNPDMRVESMSSLSSLFNIKDTPDAPDTEFIDVFIDEVPVRSTVPESQDYFIVPGYGRMSKSRMDDAVDGARRRGGRSNSTSAPVPVQSFYGKYSL